jgi:hypothetical protein
VRVSVVAVGLAPINRGSTHLYDKRRHEAMPNAEPHVAFEEVERYSSAFDRRSHMASPERPCRNQSTAFFETLAQPDLN